MIRSTAREIARKDVKSSEIVFGDARQLCLDGQPHAILVEVGDAARLWYDDISKQNVVMQ